MSDVVSFNKTTLKNDLLTKFSEEEADNILAKGFSGNSADYGTFRVGIFLDAGNTVVIRRDAANKFFLQHKLETPVELTEIKIPPRLG